MSQKPAFYQKSVPVPGSHRYELPKGISFQKTILFLKYYVYQCAATYNPLLNLEQETVLLSNATFKDTYSPESLLVIDKKNPMNGKSATQSARILHKHRPSTLYIHPVKGRCGGPRVQPCLPQFPYRGPPLPDETL